MRVASGDALENVRNNRIQIRGGARTRGINGLYSNDTMIYRGDTFDSLSRTRGERVGSVTEKYYVSYELKIVELNFHTFRVTVNNY